MARKLLLLGLLRMQEMHGYQINELIDTHLGMSIQLKRPTVYKMLGIMQQDGWIECHEEQEGNYPPRRVYTITAAGEAAFQQLLRENLADYKTISYLNNIGIVYLDELPAGELISLLRQRRQEVERLRLEIEADDKHPGGFQWMHSYHVRHLETELEWLDEVMAHYKKLRGLGD